MTRHCRMLIFSYLSEGHRVSEARRPIPVFVVRAQVCDRKAVGD